MAGFIAILHLVGWGTLFATVAGANSEPAGSPLLGVGLGVTAYTLGLRHAFDADHIAAIDNTTRKLMTDGQRPNSVGFWFSLGHSTVVFGLCVLLGWGVRGLAVQLRDDGSALQQTAGIIGVVVSGTFLLLLGVINLVVLRQVVGVFTRMRSGAYDEAELEKQLNSRGLINRVLGPVTRSIRRPQQMYPVGLLFGLGFDTATEVSLLVLASGAAVFAAPSFTIVTLPVLFAAGMCLLDTLDGILMNSAYGWAFATPVRKVYYNLTITGLSVAIALIIGTQEIVTAFAERLHITEGPIAWVGRIDPGYTGLIIVGVFLLTWLTSMTVWRVGRIDERWSARLREPAG